MKPIANRALVAIVVLVLVSCSDDGDTSTTDTTPAKDTVTTTSDTTSAADTVTSADTISASCDKNPDDPAQFVIVGFWSTTDCSGNPVSTNAFPIDNVSGCYCWPGHSGENSADTFSCDAANQAFVYTQYGSLTCGLGDNTPTVKTVYTDRCQQDIPPTLYARIVDYGPCGP